MYICNTSRFDFFWNIFLPIKKITIASMKSSDWKKANEKPQAPKHKTEKNCTDMWNVLKFFFESVI